MNSESLPQKGNEVLGHLRERVRSPLFSPYILSAILVFWRQALTIIDLTQPFDRRIAFIESLEETTWRQYALVFLLGSAYHIYHFKWKVCFNRKFYEVENEALKASTISGLRGDLELAEQTIADLHNEINAKNDDLQKEINKNKATERELNQLKSSLEKLKEEKSNVLIKLENEYERIQTIEKERKREEQRQIILKTELNFIHKSIETFLPYVNESNVPKGYALHNLLGLKLINTLTFVSNRLFRDNLQKEGKILDEQKDKIASRLNAENDPSLELSNLSNVLSSIDDKLTNEEFHLIESAANDLDNTRLPSQG